MRCHPVSGWAAFPASTSRASASAAVHEQSAGALHGHERRRPGPAAGGRYRGHVSDPARDFPAHDAEEAVQQAPGDSMPGHQWQALL